MARPRSLSDEVVLGRLLQTLSDAGPDNLTFQRAASGVGLSAATLVQRFSNREAMVEAALLHAWDLLDAATCAADRTRPLTADGAILLLLDLMPAEEDTDRSLNGLLLLREDMRNPRLRQRGAAWGAALAAALGRRLSRDTAAAERLGWQMASLWQGSIVWWGFTRAGSSQEAARQMLEDWCRTMGAAP